MKTNDSESNVAPNGDDRQAEISLPPGFAGVIAQYIHDAAPRPNYEAAIAGTLGLLAGINGGAYTVSNPPTGLNLMLALVMKSAIGKESMNQATWLHRETCRQMHKLIPDSGLNGPTESEKFITTSRSASEPALIGTLGSNPCHAQFLGEIGLLVEQLCAAGPQSPFHGLKKLLLELSDKSGPQQQVGGITYSDQSKNKAPINGPAFSLVGNTTPDSFYGAVTSDSTEGGFMSRWTVIERHSHIRPPRNRDAVTEPSRDLVGGLALMMRYAVEARGSRPAIEPAMDALELLNDFDEECDVAINATLNDAERSLHNRAYLKVQRIAGLLAIADYFGQLWRKRCERDPAPGWEIPMPTWEIGYGHVEWALYLERRGIQAITTRMAGGDMGTGDDARQKKLVSIIVRYILSPPAKYKTLHESCFIPDQYLQNNTQNVACFVKHKSGSANKGLKETINQLVDAGHLHHANDGHMQKKGMMKLGKCYLVMNLPGTETWMHEKKRDDVLKFFWR